MRCAALICVMAAFAAADAHDDVIDVFTSMAGALSETGGRRRGYAYGKRIEVHVRFQQRHEGLRYARKKRDRAGR